VEARDILINNHCVVPLPLYDTAGKLSSVGPSRYRDSVAGTLVCVMCDLMRRCCIGFGKVLVIVAASRRSVHAPTQANGVSVGFVCIFVTAAFILPPCRVSRRLQHIAFLNELVS
jgi:hypothetical protein